MLNNRGSPVVYALTIDNWHPIRLNEVIGRHGLVAHGKKKSMTQFLTFYARLQGIPAATGKRRVRLTCYGWQRGSTPDIDAYPKLLADSLVSAGLLVNDDANGLDGAIQVRYIRSPEKRTIIELEDC